jgi:phosphatidylethanolamine/phosphatidyl-N-methylethanolamine N-methyltransferase
MLREYRVFVRQFFQQYHTTGSVLPSSRSLARALCRYVRTPVNRSSANTGEPARREILEVGPGTGAVTASLVKQMKPNDRLTLVELNDEFVRHMQTRLANEPPFQKVADRTTILHKRLEDVPGEHCYDVIISGLPLNNFEVNEVEQILGVYQRLLKPGGTLSFFQYIAIRKAKSIVTSKTGRARLRGIGAALDRVLNGQEIKRDWVWPNVPPAWVHHVQFATVAV